MDDRDEGLAIVALLTEISFITSITTLDDDTTLQRPFTAETSVDLILLLSPCSSGK